MPAYDYNPNAMLAVQQMVSDFAGQDIYRRNDITITAPLWDRFRDIHSLLHGMCSPNASHLRTLQREVQIAGQLLGIAGVFTVGLTFDDHVYISNDTVPFGIKATHVLGGDDTANVFGYSNSRQLASAYGDSYRCKAPRNWVRGPYDYRQAELTLSKADNSGSIVLDTAVGIRQSVVTHIRGVTPPDILTETYAQSLMHLDITAADGAGADDQIMWYLGSDGKVVTTWKVGDFTWMHSGFAEWLGYTTSEAVIDLGNYKMLKATNYPKGIIWLDRPIEYLEPIVRGVRYSNEASDGTEESTHAMTRMGWKLKLSFDGIASTRDKLAHALKDFFAWLWMSEYFTVYSNVNELRRGGLIKDGYSTAVCGEDDYRVGTIVLNLDPAFNQFEFDPEDTQVRAQYILDLKGWEWVAPGTVGGGSNGISQSISSGP